MCNYLLALFFAVLLYIASFIFVAKILTVASCRCAQVVGGATSTFWEACAHFGFAFFVLQDFIDVYLVFLTLIYVVVEFLLFVFGSFRACFFSLQIILLHEFALARFRFFCCRCLFFCPVFTNNHSYRTARLFFPPLSSERSSTATMTIPVHFLVFCVVCMHSKYALFSPNYCSVCLVFASSIAHASVRPHLHQPVPICTHSRHFFHTLPKHDVRGNFSGHRTQILACKTIYVPCLPCFCVPRAPCAPMHPSTPIRAHSNLFVTVCTPYFHVYMYNLIQK